MEACERLVDTWIATGRDVEIDLLVEGLANKDFTLLIIIKSLGKYLTSDEGVQRGKGVALLSAVLAKLPPASLEKQTTRVLVTFYTQKLDDSETVIPGLQALLTLAAVPNFSSVEAVQVFKALAENIKMKAHVQSTRHIIFQILDALVANHREALKGLGYELVKGYISLAEGEKDPRNLLLVFSISRVVLIEFNVKDYAEDLFDITACYFPITFNPPPNDPYGITSADLKVALLSCLNASPYLGPFAMSLFLEKLAATTPQVKRDTLTAIASCLPVYGPAVTKRYGTTLWEAVKVEIFQPIDTETEQKALEAAQAIVATLYQTDDGTVDGLAETICDECVKILEEPEKNQAKHAIKVLAALVKTTANVSTLVTSRAIPHLIKLFLKPDEASNRSHIMQALTTLLSALREVYADDSNTRSYRDEKPLESTQDQLLGVISSGLKLSEVRQSTLDALLQLVQMPDYMTAEEVQFSVNEVNESLESSNDLEDLSYSVLNILSTISEKNPAAVEQTTLPLLFSVLPDVAPGPGEKTARVAYQRTLKYLSTLCLQPDLFETLVVRLSTKLELVCSNQSGPPSEYSAAYAHSILLTLDEALDAKVAQKHTDIPKYVDRLIPRLYWLFVSLAAEPMDEPALVANSRLLLVASKIIGVILRNLPASRQTTFISTLLPDYHSGDFSALVNAGAAGESRLKSAPLDPGASQTERNLVILLTAAIIPLRKEIAIPVPDVSDFLEELLKWAMDPGTTDVQARAAFQGIASIVNKHPEESANFLGKQIPILWADIAKLETPLSTRKRGVVANAHITRALLTRSHPLAQTNIDRLFELFNDPDLSWPAARAIGDLVEEDPTLSKTNFAVLRMLFVQKYVAAILPRILSGHKEAADEQHRSAYLVALTSLIKHLPRSMYIHEMSSLMPLFILGLDLPDVEMRANVIEALVALAKEDTSQTSALTDHASTVISTLLKNAVPGDSTSEKLRVAALKCLGILPNAVKYETLHPHRATVLRQTAQCLDDKKREVRRMAVDTRAVWFALGSSSS